MKKIYNIMIVRILLFYFTAAVTSQSDSSQGNQIQSNSSQRDSLQSDPLSSHIKSIDSAAEDIEKTFTNELLKNKNSSHECFTTVSNFFKENSESISNFLTTIEIKSTSDTTIHYDHSCKHTVQKLERRIKKNDFSTAEFIVDLGRVLTTLFILSNRSTLSANQKRALTSMSTYFELVALGHQKEYFTTIPNEHEVQQLVPFYSQEVTQMIEQRKGVFPTNRNPFISPLKKIQTVLLSFSSNDERSTNYTTRFYLLNDAIHELRDLQQCKEFNSNFIEELLFGIDCLLPLITIMDVYRKHAAIGTTIKVYKKEIKVDNTYNRNNATSGLAFDLSWQEGGANRKHFFHRFLNKTFPKLKMEWWTMGGITEAIRKEYFSKNSIPEKPETIFENMNKFLEHHQQSITDYLTFEKIYSNDLSKLYAYQLSTVFQELVQISKCNDFSDSTFIVTMGKLLFLLSIPPVTFTWRSIAVYFHKAAVGHRRKHFPQITNEHEIKKLIPVYSQSLTQMIEEGKGLYQRDKNPLFSSINALRKVLLSFSPNNPTLSSPIRVQLLNDAMRQLHELKQFKEFNGNFIDELLAGIPTLIAMTTMVEVYKHHDDLFTK